MKTDALFDKVYGAIIGSAIGDAMGGPVEGLHFTEIADRFGRVEDLLPYTHVKPSYHGPFDVAAGSYTDDTRISILLGRAALHAGGPPKKGDITHALAEYYFSASTDMERGFIEEYYLKGIYGDDKEAFGGRPTNGGIMGIASLGAIFPADPDGAFSHVFRTLFLSTGTARTASAFAAAMIASAMGPGVTWKQVMENAFASASGFKKEVEASGWRNSELYPIVAVKTEGLALKAMELGTAAATVDDLRENLYDAVVQPFFADGSESLAIAAAMFCAARGDFAETVIGCVNFGRDNDSSAAVGGAVAGALCGAAAIPEQWITTVEEANPGATLRSLAERLTGVTAATYRRLGRVLKRQEHLVETDDPDEPDQDGKTALHRAAAAGDDEAVRSLLRSGANVNARDSNATTPLHFAAWENHLSTVALLIGSGADPDLAEGKGWTALHDAVRREYWDICCEILSSSRMLNDPQQVAETLAGQAGDDGFTSALRVLDSHQVRLDAVGICGQSLLHDAVERGYRNAVQLLVANGADVNQLARSLGARRYEGTPLHKAAAFGRREIYEDLTAAGSDPSVRNIDGKTPEELWKEAPA